MIEIGTLWIRGPESITEIREKILGLVRSLGGLEVLATRAATAASEASRQCYQSVGSSSIGVELTPGDGSVLLGLRFPKIAFANGSWPVSSCLKITAASGSLSSETMLATLALPLPAGSLTPEVIACERARLAVKSRAELLEELRLKNLQLQEYNDSLEITVAERTAQLSAANQQMCKDLEAGAAYVRALIPPPIASPVSVDWRYVPCSSLGGDTIGYHWLDDDRLAMYLVDVTGHGVDSALLAVTISNVIRTGSLPGAEMARPDEVVSALNNTFQGERHGLRYCTIWYGVYNKRTRSLSWSGGGHHPALLLAPGDSVPRQLAATGPIIGAVPGMDFPAETCGVPSGARLLLFSDGAFEIIRDDRLVWSLEGIIEHIANLSNCRGAMMDQLLMHARSLRGGEQLDDDFSFIEARFP